MDIFVDYIDAQESGDMRHAQDIINDLDIQYKKCEPLSYLDGFWFGECTNIPENLPDYIKLSKGDN